MSYPSFYPYTYQAAKECLEGGRDKHRRPIANNTDLVWTIYQLGGGASTQAIGVVLHATEVVTYLPNGNCVLNSGGWRTHTTQDRINNFSPARVYSGTTYTPEGRVKGRGWVLSSDDNWGTTPERIQKCRVCHGKGRVKNEKTWEYVKCRGDRCLKPPSWQHSTDQMRCHGHYETLDTPIVTYPTCHRCDGAGYRDYGSKRIFPAFESGMIVNQAGELVGSAHETMSIVKSKRHQLEVARRELVELDVDLEGLEMAS